MREFGLDRNKNRNDLLCNRRKAGANPHQTGKGNAMKFTDHKPDYFDQHRKDHAGRAIAIPLALLISAVLWVGIIVAVNQLF